MTHDPAGNILTRTDARGKTATYTYDSLNRVAGITFTTGTPITYEYDGGATPVANSIGKLTRISDESGSTNWTHDPFGRVATKTQTVGSGPSANTLTIAYTWGASGSANGKLATITYPSGSRVNLGYDTAGRLSTLTLNPANANGSGPNTGTTVALLSAAAYNGTNALTGWTWGDGSAMQRSFDPQGRLKTYPLGNPAGSGAGAGAMRTLVYDNAWGITGYTHTQAGNAQPALDQSFGYDALDRLTSAGIAGTASGYGYDATGNRVSRSINATAYANTVDAASNRLSSVQTAGTGGSVTNTWSHDNAGNLTSDGSASYAYGDRGRLSSATTAAGSVSYLVNGLEQRVMKAGPTSLVSTGAAYYVHDEQGRLIGQYDANRTPIHETIYFGDTPVVVLKATGSGSAGTLQITPYYVYADQIDTPRVITRASDQAIVWRWDQAEAFGATQPQDNPSGLGAFGFDQRFPGQVFDAETGNHDNWHRTYAAGVGRYVQSDPIGLRGGANTYSYANNAPTSFVDPIGLVAWTGAIGAGAAVDVVGAAFYTFDLQSECKCGVTINIRGYAASVAGGAGLKLTGTASPITLNDKFDCPKGDAANGAAYGYSASGVIGAGGSWGRITLGSLSSGSASWSPAYGGDISALVFWGRSVVLHTEVTKCCSND
jgi:RHS repeat-associated protein